MRSISQKSFPWALSLFPLLEAVCFTASVVLLERHVGLAMLCLLMASVCMSFNIHIFLHECVHHASRYPQAFNLLASLTIGLPFDGYRIHHYNHHFHENGSQDFSTTWIYGNDGRRPRPLWSYAFGWHRQLMASLNTFTPYPASEESIRIIKLRTQTQKRFLALLLAALLVFNWHIFVVYLLLVYFGWFFTALHNYGQHPPSEDNEVRTFANPLYNRLFFNNGLHWEHHHDPSLRWDELKPDTHSCRINTLHVLNPLIQHRSS